MSRRLDDDPNRGLRLLNEMLGQYVDALKASRRVELDPEPTPAQDATPPQSQPSASRRPVPSRRPVQVNIDV
jgi:hypothetical protein